MSNLSRRTGFETAGTSGQQCGPNSTSWFASTAADKAFLNTQNAAMRSFFDFLESYQVYAANGAPDNRRTDEVVKILLATRVFISAATIAANNLTAAIWAGQVVDWRASLAALKLAATGLQS